MKYNRWWNNSNPSSSKTTLWKVVKLESFQYKMAAQAFKCDEIRSEVWHRPSEVQHRPSESPQELWTSLPPAKHPQIHCYLREVKTKSQGSEDAPSFQAAGIAQEIHCHDQFDSQEHPKNAGGHKET